MNENQVKAKLKENDLSWWDFTHWMRGQTIGIINDGSFNFYEYDVERYIKAKKQNRAKEPAFWD